MRINSQILYNMSKILTNIKYNELDTNSKLDLLFEAIANLPGNVTIGSHQNINLPDKALTRQTQKQRLKVHFQKNFKKVFPI